ncbi:nucleotide-diphospho-sugar transferase [Elsinoe ampelina]|uniref:Nucleotide-diphospho-sugar transferase n=1 Tax=Elsinoe ampelina TaxID=302913 RepID=A0A6A6G0V3_9PEZI|nr:nucleotide-diphospho-sugar transferase [Elsinoe ampelina]
MANRDFSPKAPSTSVSLDALTDDEMKSNYAYSLYVTDQNYLCPAVMMIDSLKTVGSRASRLLLHPSSWTDIPSRTPLVSHLLTLALSLGATLIPVDILISRYGDPTWADSYTKLLAFNQTSFTRVISLDTDATILQNPDALFSFPLHEKTPIAAPLAYWLENRTLSSQIMLIRPSTAEFTKVMAKVTSHEQGEFDMEIINSLYGSTAGVLPHREWDLLSGEFRRRDHGAYLGLAGAEAGDEWDATRELARAKYVHFSDWPMPKPWMVTGEEVERGLPACEREMGGRERAGEAERGDCRDREAWGWLYRDFFGEEGEGLWEILS